MISDEQLRQWRADFDRRFMASAIDEYCPDEFGQLLDEVGRLRSPAEPVAWRYRYVYPDGPRHWIVTQTPIGAQEPTDTEAGVEVQPLYLGLGDAP